MFAFTGKTISCSKDDSIPSRFFVRTLQLKIAKTRKKIILMVFLFVSCLPYNAECSNFEEIVQLQKVILTRM